MLNLSFVQGMLAQDQISDWQWALLWADLPNSRFFLAVFKIWLRTDQIRASYRRRSIGSTLYLLCSSRWFGRSMGMVPFIRSPDDTIAWTQYFCRVTLFIHMPCICGDLEHQDELARYRLEGQSCPWQLSIVENEISFSCTIERF
jgi:hypothetical protein